MIKIIRFGEPPLIASGFSRRFKLTFLGCKVSKVWRGVRFYNSVNICTWLVKNNGPGKW